MKKRLRRGVQSFESLITQNCYYVDKTEHIFKMLEGDECYFLSRPRRFGKTLLVNTIKSLFEGKSELFKNTYICDKWDFKKNTYPVVHLNFAGGKYKKEGEIEYDIIKQLNRIERKYNIVGGDNKSIIEKLCNIIELISKNKFDVVVLVDEYDQPILDVIDDQQLAKSNRDSVAEIYAAIKRSCDFLRFVFVTGITMFSKDDMSSGMNHFTDISLDPDFSTICGYTEKELCDVFSPELKGVDIKKIRDYYNGYSWDGKTSVYNPYSILYYLEKKIFKPFWNRTYRPESLYNLLKEKEFYLIGSGKCSVKEKNLCNFNINNIDINSLLFQMGVYTIKRINYDEQSTPVLYDLDFPNKEVREDFPDDLYENYFGIDLDKTTNHGKDFLKLLKLEKFDQAIKPLNNLYAEIPNEWYRNISVSNYEVWYASALLFTFLENDCNVRAEESSHLGRSDFVLIIKGYVFVFELKVIEGNKKDNQAEISEAVKLAFEQIKQRNYLAKYSSIRNTLYSVAVVMSQKDRNIVKLEFQKHTQET